MTIEINKAAIYKTVCCELCFLPVCSLTHSLQFKSYHLWLFDALHSAIWLKAFGSVQCVRPPAVVALRLSDCNALASLPPLCAGVLQGDFPLHSRDFHQLLRPQVDGHSNPHQNMCRLVIFKQENVACSSKELKPSFKRASSFSLQPDHSG